MNTDPLLTALAADAIAFAWTLVGLIFAASLPFLAREGLNLLAALTARSHNALFRAAVEEAVKAAEQLFAGASGEAKLAYAEGTISRLFPLVPPEDVRRAIEAAVLELPRYAADLAVADAAETAKSVPTAPTEPYVPPPIDGNSPVAVVAAAAVPVT